MSIKHRMLLKHLAALEYQVNENGMCYGFAASALLAFLSEDIITYNERLDLLEEATPEELVKVLQFVRDEVKLKNRLIEEAQLVLTIPAFFDRVALTHASYEYDIFSDSGISIKFYVAVAYACNLRWI